MHINGSTINPYGLSMTINDSMGVSPLERNVWGALFEVTGELVCWLLLCFVANGSANWILAPWRWEKEVVGRGQVVLIG